MTIGESILFLCVILLIMICLVVIYQFHKQSRQLEKACALLEEHHHLSKYDDGFAEKRESLRERTSHFLAFELK